MTKSKLRASPKSHAIYWRAFQALKDLRSLSAKEMVLLAEDLGTLPTKPGSIRVKRIRGQSYSGLITDEKAPRSTRFFSKPVLTKDQIAYGQKLDRDLKKRRKPTKEQLSERSWKREKRAVRARTKRAPYDMSSIRSTNKRNERCMRTRRARS